MICCDVLMIVWRFFIIFGWVSDNCFMILVWLLMCFLCFLMISDDLGMISRWLSDDFLMLFGWFSDAFRMFIFVCFYICILFFWWLSDDLLVMVWWFSVDYVMFSWCLWLLFMISHLLFVVACFKQIARPLAQGVLDHQQFDVYSYLNLTQGEVYLPLPLRQGALEPRISFPRDWRGSAWLLF
jgi:hypothetical protein